MAARRDRIPVRWRAVQEIDRRGATPVIAYRHIWGITRGMAWRGPLPKARRCRRRIRHDFWPPWPVVGDLIATTIIGPHFVDYIAGRTLGTIKSIVEREMATAAATVIARRVAITGLGPITPIGNGVDGLWDGVRRGNRRCERSRASIPRAFTSRVAAEVTFEPLDFMSPKKARRLDRFSQIALACAQMALLDAGSDSRGRRRGGHGHQHRLGSGRSRVCRGAARCLPRPRHAGRFANRWPSRSLATRRPATLPSSSA